MSTGTVIVIVVVALCIAVYWRAVLVGIAACVIALMFIGIATLTSLDEGSCAPDTNSTSPPPASATPTPAVTSATPAPPRDVR